MVSVNWRLPGEKWNHSWPNWITVDLLSICEITSK
jgi:hypothetical protein